MSTTHRLNVLSAAAYSIWARHDLWFRLRGRVRLGGGPYTLRTRYHFEVRLPEDIADVVLLIGYCRLGAVAGPVKGVRMVGRAVTRMGQKLAEIVGLPWVLPGGGPEVPYLSAIASSPGDLAIWQAYADWLQERHEQRGEVIARWLSEHNFSETKER